MTTRDAAHADSFRPDVEGLRGVAVLAVVLFHAGLLGVVGGYVGVDVFFVISGFLITGLLLRERTRTGRIGFLQFYARRARRLLPAGIVVLVLTLLSAWNLVAPLDRAAIGLDGAAAALSVGNVRFAMAAGDYFSSVTTPSPFLHFWSLAVEEQFYLIWPALILVVARGGSAGRRVGIALVAIVAASFVANLVLTDEAANWAFYSLPTRAWELGLGGLLAVTAAGLMRLPGWIVGLAGWLGLAAIAVSCVAFDSSIAFPGVAAVLPALGATLVIAGGSRRLGPGGLLSLAPLRAVGKISYSLYLVHWPILVLAPMALGIAPDAATNALLVAVAFVAAAISWAYIETPFRTGMPVLSRRPRRTLSLAMGAIVAVVVTATIPAVGASGTGGVVGAQPPVEEPWPSDDGWVDESAAPVTPAPSGTPTAAPSDPSTPGPTATPRPTTTPTTPAPRGTHGRLPDDVRPSLGQARDDEERLRGDGCLAFERVVVPPDCVYGVRDAAFTIALVGDSHAAHWFPALERLAKHEGWRIVTFVKVACPFIDMRVGNIALKREYRECADFNEATIDRLGRLRPDLTIVSMSRIAIHPLAAADDTVAAKGAAIGRMVARIPGRTALLVDTPYAGFDVPGCLSAHPTDVDACAIGHRTAFTDHLGAMERVAAAASGAAVIDLTARICVEDPCPVVVDRMIVFRDIGHLTATYSRSLAPALDAQIRRIIQAGKASGVSPG